jgi:hypothetical protein
MSELNEKYRGINGICLNCLNMKLATGRKSFCACKLGRLQDQNRTDCKHYHDADVCPQCGIATTGGCNCEPYRNLSSSN